MGLHRCKECDRWRIQDCTSLEGFITVKPSNLSMDAELATPGSRGPQDQVKFVSLAVRSATQANTLGLVEGVLGSPDG